MGFIRFSWRAPDHVEASDLVDAVAQAGLPVLGRSGLLSVLHGDGRVTQHAGTRAATAALTREPGNELIVWLLQGSAVAATVRRLEERVECVLSLDGAPAEEQQEAARAVDALLDGLDDVQIEARLSLPPS
jgi:hypothetical protein